MSKTAPSLFYILLTRAQSVSEGVDIVQVKMKQALRDNWMGLEWEWWWEWQIIAWCLWEDMC